MNDPALSVTNFIASGIPGCSKTGESNVVFLVYVLLVVVETGEIYAVLFNCDLTYCSEIMLLTLYRAIRAYKRRREGTNVLRTLLQHNIFYYVCGLGRLDVVFNARHQK